MSPHRSALNSAVLAAAVLLLVTTGCSEESTPPKPGPSGDAGSSAPAAVPEEKGSAAPIMLDVTADKTHAVQPGDEIRIELNQAPILLWIYTPHWAPIKYEGEWVDFPRYTDECYKDPKWGMNPDKAYDCGKPRGWIKKVGWKGGEEKWPNAYQAVRNFRITNQEMGAMVGRVDLDGKSVDEVVAAWMEKNRDHWMAWTQ